MPNEFEGSDIAVAAKGISALLSGGGQSAQAEAPTPDNDDDAQAADGAEQDESEGSQEDTDDAAPPEQESRDEDEGEPEPAKSPSLDAPASWGEAEKAEFAKLPPALQQVVLKREREATTEVRRAQSEAAELRRAIDPATAQLQQARDRYIAQVSQYLTSEEKSFAERYQDIKTPADLSELARKDPVRFNEFQADREGLIAAHNARANAIKEAQQQHGQEHGKFLAAQHKALVEKMPELTDRKAADKLDRDLRDYALTQGFSDADYDSAADHRAIIVLRKAMLYDKMQAARPAVEQKLKDVPKIVKPGTSQGKGAARDERLVAARKNLRRTGSIDDAAALIGNLVGRQGGA